MNILGFIVQYLISSLTFVLIGLITFFIRKGKSKDRTILRNVCGDLLPMFVIVGFITIGNFYIDYQRGTFSFLNTSGLLALFVFGLFSYHYHKKA